MGLFGGGDVTRDDYVKLQDRVARLEVQVARLAAALNASSGGATAVGGVEMSETATSAEADGQLYSPWLFEARALVAQGKTIAAIKVVREGTGWGLKESKDFVERQL